MRVHSGEKPNKCTVSFCHLSTKPSLLFMHVFLQTWPTG
jgi:hypothetical protein